ncbi:GNAT family N-acetyltransferase [Embleya scabrispora]|uniref:GNAT family N-acetyltransferase n=1 Tax=Embleya scabrispora TaxID=159449 RepID=UPI000376F9CB|nr:GNAT family N-acetyltransferase [Embleya scabrispora]MYS87156.1 GNAT family N-acetyltransferase [Streptomyces sp. SID5474]
MNVNETAWVRTDRLELIPVGIDHAEEMVEVLGDRALHAFIGGEPEDLAALRARYTRWAKGSPDPKVTWLNRVIRLRAQERLVGTVQATVGPGSVAEVAWVVGRAWQGLGIAKEAAIAWVAWLRAHGVEEVRAHIHPDNLASAGVAKAAGLRPTEVWQEDERRWSTVGPKAPAG